MILLPPERRVLNLLREWSERHGYAPTLREIKEMLQVSSMSFVQDLLKRLQEKGYIERQRGRARTIRLLSSELPLRGFIQAGYLTEHPASYSDRICLDGHRYREGDYALKVCGNSMADAQILNGDVVVIRPENDLWAIRPGQIAVIWIEGEGTTIKRVYYAEGDAQIILEPASLTHETRTLERSQVGLQGVQVGLHRYGDGIWVLIKA
ncbi:MAG: repressor LexA [Leptolyngbyaceae cyanobacterium SM2_5_2]|nr:repressor LexA [Leptolyngbyaceae cyanobacterium SM2_5_2]